MTRHPLFFGVSLFAMGMLFTQPCAAGNIHNVFSQFPGQAFWLGFPLFYIIGGYHQDLRLQFIQGRKLEISEFFHRTSLLPFKAIIDGRNSFYFEEYPLKDVLFCTAAVGIFWVLRLKKLPVPLSRYVIRPIDRW